MMDVEIINVSGSKPIGTLQVSPRHTISQVKADIAKLKKNLIVDRQSIRTEPKGKAVKDSVTLSSLGIQTGGKLYMKDLGPQISWKTVFLAEYAGPMFVYLWLYQRPWIFYGDVDSTMSYTSTIACACWSLHYLKRLLETLFIHRFSHATMPLRNLFKNCSYYWLFTMYVAYYVNHPLYTEPMTLQMYIGLAGFLFSEFGNLSIHVALRNLRPPGTTTRKIPQPTGNPFTILFDYVSCPNYLYEFMSWGSFTLLTQCLPAGLFALAGMFQMTIWALGKHKNYKKEFPSYPRNRKAIIPFVL
ncbi:Sc2 [Carabus blaptoides fortunei]